MRKVTLQSLPVKLDNACHLFPPDTVLMTERSCWTASCRPWRDAPAELARRGADILRRGGIPMGSQVTGERTITKLLC